MASYNKQSFFLLTFSLLSVTNTGTSCPSGWITSNKNCYKFVTNTTRTWSDALSDCKVTSGSHLVHINSAQENGFVVSELRSLLKDGDIRHAGVWIGATDNNREGFWAWGDNDEPVLEYTNWNIGEPDTGSGDHEEDCACMYGSVDFRWQDRRCSEKYMYICEIADGSISNTEHTNNNHGCESGWSLHGQSCYKFVTDQGRLEWSPADEYCKARHAHLAIIESRDEDTFLAHEMGQRIDLDHSMLLTGVWVGGTDSDHEGRWVWRDSANHTDTLISGYTNWYKGQPDSGDGEKEEDCLCLIGSRGFQWQDYRCRDNMFFICEKPATTGSHVTIVG